MALRVGWRIQHSDSLITDLGNKKNAKQSMYYLFQSIYLSHCLSLDERCLSKLLESNMTLYYLCKVVARKQNSQLSQNTEYFQYKSEIHNIESVLWYFSPCKNSYYQVDIIINTGTAYSLSKKWPSH